MSALTRPDCGPATTDTEDGPDHIYCCDPNRSLCGLDITNETDLGEYRDDHIYCPLCVVADETLESCPSRLLSEVGMNAARPHVRVDPAQRFGQPTVGAISTDAIAAAVWSGEDVKNVADAYDLSRAQVLVGCWYEGARGSYAARLGDWAAQAEMALSDERYDDADDPPSRHDTTTPTRKQDA